MEKFGEFFHDFSKKCCIRLAHISEKELTIFTYCLMPSEDGFTTIIFKNKGKYSAGTYLLVSTEIKNDNDEGDIDAAFDMIASHVGLVRVIWGQRTAWSLVQRSIVETSNGNMRDPSPVIPIPNINNRIWDDGINKKELICILKNPEKSERLWRSLRIASRGSDASEPDKALWFWSAMEVLCDAEACEVKIVKALARVYGGTGDTKEARKKIKDKFGIPYMARARHDIAHKGYFRNHGGEITEYYAALYIDLLSGLYLGKCVKRAERMINNGFDINILNQENQNILSVYIGD